ncbi:PAS domain S-box protein, partial [bacterium]
AGAAGAPATAPTLDSLEIRGSRLRLRQPVAFNDETLGSLYLEAHYDTFERVRAYLAIFSVIALVSLVAALVLSAVVQRVLTVPLEAIARVAQGIVHEGDYSLRVTRSTEDEIGLVVQALNRMLDEVQQRKVALEETNASLREQIAERQRAERLRRETEGIYRAIGESIDYGVWITDAVGRGIYVSDSFLRLTGLTIEEVHGRGWTHLLPEDEQEATRRAWTETQLRGESWYRDTSVRGVDGTYHPVLTLGVPIRADDGTLAGWAGINLDISTLKRTEEALREADRRKDEFLATLAHELRNPLAPIRQAARILDAPAATPAQHQWCRDVIGRQVTHMALLLDDLLDVSRITRGRMELRPE